MRVDANAAAKTWATRRKGNWRRRKRRPASRMVLVARRIVVEREGIKLAIQDKGTVDARMHG